MKCPHCGKEINSNEIYCPYCGKKIKTYTKLLILIASIIAILSLIILLIVPKIIEKKEYENFERKLDSINIRLITDENLIFPMVEITGDQEILQQIYEDCTYDIHDCELCGGTGGNINRPETYFDNNRIVMHVTGETYYQRLSDIECYIRIHSESENEEKYKYSIFIERSFYLPSRETYYSMNDGFGSQYLLLDDEYVNYAAWYSQDGTPVYDSYKIPKGDVLTIYKIDPYVLVNEEYELYNYDMIRAYINEGDYIDVNYWDLQYLPR